MTGDTRTARTAKFARSAIAMTRHVNKGIHAKLGLDRRHANVRKVAKVKNKKRQMESLVTAELKERYTKLRDRIDMDKQGEYTPTDPTRACRHEDTILPKSTI